MNDARKTITRQMGFSTSSMPATVLPPDVKEDTCPLCGHFQPLDDRGYCDTEECNDAARQMARKIAREKGGNVPGLYYKFGDLEVINFSKLEQWEEPKPTKHPDMCSSGECTDYALPADYLCRYHRIAEQREEYLARKARRNVSAPRRRKARSDSKIRGNKIRGLNKIKL